ncbi:sugar phosphate isomerase/epimerase [Stackebrandtia albiflava]|uniref:Sugar phosphate isomerase/epimerase n=1 Tax=Stackebrandtia albiflava TaxID=406432 RepID=A0A562UYZ7_9ACTN|nr:sugar phosphate isomerase/epimerase family protein [Stackebrandtia albiflava]TWJ10832.1 sugar phosphate isomerase/epimerase [Stackebrandtia albiflava]
MYQAGFSTLGFPGRPVPEVLDVATRHGADLVQLRIAEDEPVNPGLSSRGRAEVASRFGDAGVAVGALATYVRLSDPDLLEPLHTHLELAVDLGAPALRLFPGDTEPEVAADRLAAAVDAAEGSGVRLTVETHDAFLSGTAIARLLAGVTGRAGAVWDLLHTWRSGEKPADSAALLGPYLAEFQIKDVSSAEDRRPLVPGTGVLPIRETVALVRGNGFTGPIVFEHEARWYADAAPFEESLAAALRLARGE